MNRLLHCRLVLPLTCVVLFGCDTDGPVDAGARVDAPAPRPDAAVELCAADGDCDDGDFCSVLRCRPGDSAADARGCVATGSPCASGESCDETADTCIPATCGAVTDVDGDGHDSVACGGNDCDDTDDQRFGGNTEVCDTTHDEDCDASTVAGSDDGDSDGDGFTSAMCCNGETCGDDCDDSDRGVFPGARELCNGRDDNCDGVADEVGATPLCPGGVCRAGRCDLAAWSRTFGGSAVDVARAVAMDSEGNVYVAGEFSRTASFGGGSPIETSTFSNGFVASYSPDGAYRWVRTYLRARVWDISWDDGPGRLYLVGTAQDDVDLGAGVRAVSFLQQNYLVALTSDGVHQWDRLLDSSGNVRVVGDNGPVVAQSLEGSRNFGGDVLTATGVRDLAITRYGVDGSHVWDYRTRGGPSGFSAPWDIARAGSGQIAVAGAYSNDTIDFGGGPRVNHGGGDGFAVVVDAAGEHVWDYTAGGAGLFDEARAVAATAAGDLIIAGSFSGTVDFGGPSPVSSPATRAFLIRLTADGSFDTGRYWGDGDSYARGLATDSSGGVLAVGAISGAVDFGGGPLTASTSPSAYFVRFDSRLLRLSDEAFDAPAPCSCHSSATGIAVGPADSTVVAGSFTGSIELEGRAASSAGDEDGFLVRLAN